MTYEVACNIQTGDICWAFGGFPAGVNDLTLARMGLHAVLPAGEKVVADKGYWGQYDRFICPSFLFSSSATNKQLKLMMARHENINKRIKDFKCMRGIWRHGEDEHVKSFYAVVTLVQLKIENGNPIPPPYVPRVGRSI